MEVVPDLRQRVLRRFPFEITKLVDTTALHGDTAPYLADRAPQPGIAVDHREHRRAQATRHEIRETAFPRRERLPTAEIEGEELLTAVA